MDKHNVANNVLGSVPSYTEIVGNFKVHRPGNFHFFNDIIPCRENNIRFFDFDTFY